MVTRFGNMSQLSGTFGVLCTSLLYSVFAASSTADLLERYIEHTSHACDDICYLDLLVYMFLILILLLRSVYGPDVHTYTSYIFEVCIRSALAFRSRSRSLC